MRKLMSTWTSLHLYSAVLLAQGHSKRLLAETRAPDPGGHLLCLEQHRSGPAISHLTHRKKKKRVFTTRHYLKTRQTTLNHVVPFYVPAVCCSCPQLTQWSPRRWREHLSLSSGRQLRMCAPCWSPITTTMHNHWCHLHMVSLLRFCVAESESQPPTDKTISSLHFSTLVYNHLNSSRRLKGSLFCA